MTVTDSMIPSDKLMWDWWFSFVKIPSVSVADEVGIFRALQDNPSTISAIAETLNLNQKGVKSLFQVLVCLEFLEQNSGSYSLSETAKHYLIPGKECYWGAILEGHRQLPEHLRLTKALKEGGYHLLYEGKPMSEIWESGEISRESAEKFTRRMHNCIFAPCQAAVASELFEDRKRILDVGGGSGAFGIALARRFPNKKSTVFDLAPVCDAARVYVQLAKSTEQVSFTPGNFFKDNLPKGHDGVWFSNILHDWPPNVCDLLLQRAYEALDPGGKIFIHEILQSNGKPNLTASAFDLLMFMNHSSQQFTETELYAMLKRAGFKNAKRTNTFGYYSVISASR